MILDARSDLEDPSDSEQPRGSSPSQCRVRSPAFPRAYLDWCTRECIIVQGELVCNGWNLINKSRRQSRFAAWHGGSFCFKMHTCHLIALPAGVPCTLLRLVCHFHPPDCLGIFALRCCLPSSKSQSYPETALNIHLLTWIA